MREIVHQMKIGESDPERSEHIGAVFHVETPRDRTFFASPPGIFTPLSSGQMTWEQFEGQLDNPVMEAGRNRMAKTGTKTALGRLAHMHQLSASKLPLDLPRPPRQPLCLRLQGDRERGPTAAHRPPPTRKNADDRSTRGSHRGGRTERRRSDGGATRRTSNRLTSASRRPGAGALVRDETGTNGACVTRCDISEAND